MHKTLEGVVTDRLWPEIVTLNWVLNEILLLVVIYDLILALTF